MGADRHVAALFRRIPLPGFARHTNIIIRKRDDIADGLAVFVKENTSWLRFEPSRGTKRT